MRPRPKTIESKLRRWFRLRLFYLLHILPRLSFYDDESESYSPTHESHYERDLFERFYLLSFCIEIDQGNRKLYLNIYESSC